MIRAVRLSFMRKLFVIANVKKIVWLLLIISPILNVWGAEADTTVIKSFSTATYKASSFNYTGIESPDGILYFANENGVLEYDGSRWRLIPISNFSAVTALALVKGRIYVGGRDEFGYLERDSIGEHRYVSLRHLLKPKEGDLLKDVWQIVAVGDDIYYGSLEMILRYDGREVHTIPLKGSYIFKINNRLYASAMKQGLAKINKDSINFVNKQFSFPLDAAFQYIKGLKGENFIVTADHGIFELDTLTFKTKKWETPANKLLSKNFLYSANIWQDSLYAFSTYLGGLFIVDEQGKVVKLYNKGNGLYGNALRESFKDKRGNLWLTSDYGLYYVQQPELLPNKQALPLETVIRHININEQDLPVANNAPSLSTSEGYAGSVVFHFATPGYHAEELEYSYYLEGFEKSWSGWKTEVKKEYTNLSGGDYTFHVKSRYKGSIESVPASMQLRIPTPWYKTKAAYLLGILLISAVIVSVIQYRTKKLKLLNKRLSKIISKRTKELVEQREQLRAANNELRVRNSELDNFVYRSSHDLVAPLKSLKGLINITQQEREEINRITYLKLMHTSVEKLEDFIKSIMEYSSNAKKDILKVEINLHQIIDSIVEDLKYYEKAERIELIRKIDEQAVFYSDPKRLKIILSNLITNSIKYHNYYQENLYIEVGAEEIEGFVHIYVKDNGKGIEENYVGRVFDMFFRASDNAQGSGLGLYIVKDTVEKLGGKISLSSVVNKGTTFTLLFPTNKDAETTLNVASEPVKTQ